MLISQSFARLDGEQVSIDVWRYVDFRGRDYVSARACLLRPGIALWGYSGDVGIGGCIGAAKQRVIDAAMADLRRKGDARRANFTCSNLTSADLSGADLGDALFDGANLSNADLTGANIGGGVLTNARGLTL